jgi:hypothetical protein
MTAGEEEAKLVYLFRWQSFERFQDGEFDGRQLRFNEIGTDLRIPVAGSASFLEVSL